MKLASAQKFKNFVLLCKNPLNAFANSNRSNNFWQNFLGRTFASAVNNELIADDDYDNLNKSQVKYIINAMQTRSPRNTESEGNDQVKKNQTNQGRSVWRDFVSKLSDAVCKKNIQNSSAIK